jgi:hypothetical protein
VARLRNKSADACAIGNGGGRICFAGVWAGDAVAATSTSILVRVYHQRRDAVLCYRRWVRRSTSFIIDNPTTTCSGVP